MKTLLQAFLVIGLYISFLFFESFVGFFEMGLSGTQVSAQSSSTVILRDVEYVSVHATYGLADYDRIQVQFIASNEIPKDLVYTSCPGSVDLSLVHVDRGVEYVLTYTPSQYCEEVVFSLHDTEITRVSWSHWGLVLSNMLDMPNDHLVQQIRELSAQMSEVSSDEEREYLRRISSSFSEILSSRSSPDYLVPVPGARIPTHTSYIPNAPRPYRKDYTDGIHHGWDFYGSFGAPIVALDDGVVIYVRDDFEWDDFNAIEHDLHTKEASQKEIHELENLDVLRGNQVWIKTMTGDVAFYSHFNEITEGLKEGDVVARGQQIGTIGVTGVPLRGYNQYHLHMPLMINPLLESKIGKNTRLDIMRWDWYGKHKDDTWIFENQKNIFLYQ